MMQVRTRTRWWLLACIIFSVFVYVSIAGQYGSKLSWVEDAILKFTQSHDGRLPLNREELIAGRQDSLYKCIDWFDIKYGHQFEGVKLDQGHLVDSQGTPFLIIEGRRRNWWVDLWFKERHHHYTLELYQSIRGGI